MPDDVPIEGVPWEQSRFLDTLYGRTTAFDDAFFGGVAIGIGIELLLVITIAILVAVPPAHRYFVPRPPTPAWPAGYAGYRRQPPAFAGGRLPAVRGATVWVGRPGRAAVSWSLRDLPGPGRPHRAAGRPDRGSLAPRVIGARFAGGARLVTLWSSTMLSARSRVGGGEAERLLPPEPRSRAPGPVTGKRALGSGPAAHA